MTSDEERAALRRAVDRVWSSALGGLLVVGPGLLLVEGGASTAVVMAYLMVMIVGCGSLVIRRRERAGSSARLR
jgi:hypothetical protein